jgi:hypothetical protein
MAMAANIEDIILLVVGIGLRSGAAAAEAATAAWPGGNEARSVPARRKLEQHRGGKIQFSASHYSCTTAQPATTCPANIRHSDSRAR